MKRWEIIGHIKNKISNSKYEGLIDLLLKNREIITKKEQEQFLHPTLEEITVESVGIDKNQLTTTIKRIQEAIKQKEQVVVFGDYDVDGIAGSAILWETLRDSGAIAVPYIPHRVDEGYGLSIRGIDNIKNQIENIKLIITVDNGIVANQAVDYANSLGIDVIITDHHVVAQEKPNAYAIVHTTKLCGTGVAWMLSQKLKAQSEKLKNDDENDHLGFVALATVADLVPLTGANRILTIFGIDVLRNSQRPGLKELFKEAAIDQSKIGVYEIGHMIAPRLNAMGRLEYAMDSLRLLCTKSQIKAQDLAMLLSSTNKERQQLTVETVLHAVGQVRNSNSGIKNVLFIADQSYQPGVIGLVAGRLVEEFYRPSIVLSIGEQYSKASARSVRGFNIIEFIRSASDYLVDAGGHPMAAGFTVETAKLTLLQKVLEKKAQEVVTEEHLTRTLKIDCELSLPAVNILLYEALQQLSPFGMGNPEPLFITKQVVASDIRLIGKESTHMKFKITQGEYSIDCIAFGMADKSADIQNGTRVDIAYTINMNEWNGRKSLQLKVKDIKISI